MKIRAIARPSLLVFLLAVPPLFSATSPVAVSRFLSVVSCVEVTQDGQIVTDGKFLLNTGDTSDFLTRFNADGSVDEAFRQNIARIFRYEPVDRPRASVLALAEDSEGRLLVAWIRHDSKS